MIVQRGIAVQGHADQKLMLLKQRHPFLIQQGRIGLQGIVDRLSLLMCIDIRCKCPKVIDAGDRRLSALKGEGDVGFPVQT